MNSITSMKPYLIRAIYEWCADNGYTSYISVLKNGCTGVPADLFVNNRVTLNIGAQSVNNLLIGNETIQFIARFSGVEKKIEIDIEAVAAIFAQESGQGFTFISEMSAEMIDNEMDADDILLQKKEQTSSIENKQQNRVSLKVVK